MSEMWFLRLIKNWTLSTCGLKLYHLGKVCFSGRLAVLYPFYQNCAYLGNEMSQSTFQSCCLCRQSEEVKPCFPHSACNPIRGFVLWNYPTKGNRASAFRLPFLCLCSDNSLLITSYKYKSPSVPKITQPISLICTNAGENQKHETETKTF